MASCCSLLSTFSSPWNATGIPEVEHHFLVFGTSVNVSPQSLGKARGSQRSSTEILGIRAFASSTPSRATRVYAANEDSGSASSPTTAVEDMEKIPVPGGCPGCGKPEKLGGCNGEGRIQGGIGAIPGFGWLPIKAYRPCPFFIETGGRYRRTGQSLEEVAFGRKGKGDDLNVSERLKKK